MKKIIKVVDFIDTKILFRLQSGIMKVTIWVLMAVIAVMIFSRDILRDEIIQGPEEILTLMTAWLYFIGGSLASREDSHISADLISSMFKSKLAKNIHHMILCLITVIVSTIVGVWAFQWVVWTADKGSISHVYHYPMALVYLPVFIFLLMSVVYYFAHAVKAIERIREELKERRLETS